MRSRRFSWELLHTDADDRPAAIPREPYGVRAGMSHKVNRRDNAVVEHFFLSLKIERVRRSDSPSPKEIRTDTADYIVSRSNPHTWRLHPTPGNRSQNGLRANGERFPGP